MKNVICCGFVAVTLALSAAASAQDRKMDDKMDKMKSETSYTGCIERSTDRAFTLRHAMASSATTKKSTGKDSMAKDAMASTLGLASTSVDLAKHVGRKVIVKGVAGDTMGGMATLTVKSIKMVGSSCS
jgi:hypothetical protein